MKKMKKLLCTILALMFVLSLATTALADTDSKDGLTTADGNNSASIDITAAAEKAASDDPATVYSVTISWEVTPGVIKVDADTYAWNTSELKYVKTEVNTVSDTSPASLSVTVTNYSNAAVTATLSASDDALFALPEHVDLVKDVASAAASISDFKDPEATGTAVEAKFENYALALTGASANTTNLGSVIVTIAPAA